MDHYRVVAYNSADIIPELFYSCVDLLQHDGPVFFHKCFVKVFGYGEVHLHFYPEGDLGDGIFVY